MQIEGFRDRFDTLVTQAIEGGIDPYQLWGFITGRAVVFVSQIPDDDVRAEAVADIMEQLKVRLESIQK